MEGQHHKGYPEALTGWPQALLRTGNKENALIRSTSLFAEIHKKNGLKPLIEALETGEHNSAVLWAHTLKGQATTIGAEEVAKLADQLETQLKKETQLQKTQLLVELETALSCVLNSIFEYQNKSQGNG